MDERKHPIANNELMQEFAQTIEIFANLALRQYECAELDDLLQAGHEGLLQACQGYDPQRGVEFRTFAELRIRGAILDEARRENRARRVRSALEDAVREAIEGEIAELTFRGRGTLPFMRRMHGIVDAALAKFVRSAPEIYDPDRAYEDREAALRLEEGLATLRPRVREYLHLHLRAGLSNNEIAERWGVGKPAVSAARHEAERSLRLILSDDSHDDEGE